MVFDFRERLSFVINLFLSQCVCVSDECLFQFLLSTHEHVIFQLVLSILEFVSKLDHVDLS